MGFSTRRDLLAGSGGLALGGALGGGMLPARADAAELSRAPMLQFADAEVAAAAKAAKAAAPTVTFQLDPALGPQAYRIVRAGDGFRVTGGDVTGAMYGGLDVAEALRLGPGAMARLLEPRLRRPLVLQRGVKFNIPLDARTPSYGDDATSARKNTPEVWTRDFWRDYFDELARHRYNVLSLWSMHPFPSLVKVPEFPDVALDDVWRSKAPLGPVPFDLTGRNATPAWYLAEHEVVKTITIDQKIAFWREVMQMAAERGIDIYIFTWNVFTYGAAGKHGIDDDMANPATVAYMRASVRELVNTYPLLKGLGITAGENMPKTPGVTKEQWLWSTYGEGVRDALKADPHRDFKLVHRFWQTSGEEIRSNWIQYPGWTKNFAFSFKYSWAHMYSDPKPRFVETVMPLLDELKMKTALEVRNDDVYSLRWGDPQFVRQYVAGMPPVDKLLGFYMGSDGYTWGRDFLDRATADQDLGPARRLDMQKHWYSFMLWGRLSYDPTVPDALFVETIRARYPGADAERLFRATAVASKIIPQTTRFFWHDTDLDWLPEASVGFDRTVGARLHTIGDFMAGRTMPDSQILNVRQWAYRKVNGLPMEAVTPLQVADNLAGFSQETLQLCSALRADPANLRTQDLREMVGDNEAMAHLGAYYAEKIRGASDLALFDFSGDEADRQSAIARLRLALGAWRRYAAVRDAQYVPAFYARIGWIDVTALTGEVAKDVDTARAWTPHTLRFDPKSPIDQHIGDMLRTV